jgi:hypothetical protein
MMAPFSIFQSLATETRSECRSALTPAAKTLVGAGRPRIAPFCDIQMTNVRIVDEQDAQIRQSLRWIAIALFMGAKLDVSKVPAK